MAANQGTGSATGSFGLGMSIGGLFTSAIGAYYSVQAFQSKARQQADALEHQRQMSFLNARAAERDAQASLLAGQEAAGRVGQRFAQIRGTTRARQAAAGIQAGVGSAGEVMASIELARQTDQLTITRNALREANAARRGREAALSRGRFAGASAQGLRATADSASRTLAGASSLIGGSGRVAQQWYALGRSR